ncbi:dihydropteroate synthase [Agreia pratensis]|uniref:dihydropteroate synthase n=1 Tax=Agreia pratensis TaxID=150121 RepID=UPI00188D38A0|nr:dihydropteroate synthase [Agreia pratensis]MBF4635253.1 dihydropteroate synthase [Agreia pratensis]
MGILNVTPDSFSDGGRFNTLDAALEHAADLTAQGADLIDIGGESTRPGAERVPVAEEQRRVLPLVRELARGGIAVSVDTMNAATALAAAHAGAAVINDVSGGLADPDMTRVAIETGLPFVVMHWRGHSAEMAAKASYADVVSDVRRELEYRVAELIVRGVDPAKIIVDPGIGFSKNAEHNWALLGHYSELASLGLPVLVAASRKGFLAPLVAEGAAPDARDAPSAVVAAIAASQGAWAVRVHDVAQTRAALDVADAWRKGARS